MQSTKTIENYLKTIALLQRNNSVRAIDIVKAKNVSKPTVSVLLKDLEREGYLTVSGDRKIHLTEKGEGIAESVIERNEFLKSFLIEIGIDEKTVSEKACELEHTIYGGTYLALKKYVNSRV